MQKFHIKFFHKKEKNFIYIAHLLYAIFKQYNKVINDSLGFTVKDDVSVLLLSLLWSGKRLKLQYDLLLQEPLLSIVSLFSVHTFSKQIFNRFSWYAYILGGIVARSSVGSCPWHFSTQELSHYQLFLHLLAIFSLLLWSLTNWCLM